MNILVLNWRDMKHPQAGGAEVHFQEIFKRFVQNGHRVFLLATRWPGSAAQDEQDGITVYRWGNTFLFNWQAPFLIRKVCRRHPVDCIIDDVNKLPFFSPQWFPKRKCGVIFHHLFGSTVFELTAYPFARYVLFMERLSALAYKKTPCCTVSQSTATELAERGFSAENIRIIPNSVDTDRYAPDAAVAKEPDLLVYAGRLKKYKNVEIILDAVQRFSRNGKRVRLAIAGTGDHEQNLVAYARELGVTQQVRFLGFVDEATKIDLYRRAAVFVNPSIKEGWGITNIEAGACGTAVVANNAPGLRDSVRNNETGLLYKENDCDDLVRCLVAVLDDQALRTRFEAGGRAHALGFSWDESARRMEAWVKEAVCAK
jgi:glycosyltransferase involved in cell wall biosynthesis